MEWCDYYDRFYDWAESTQISRISGLTGFDESCQVAEIVMNIWDTAAASRLVRKAMAEGVRFTADEVIDMLDFLSDEAIVETIKSCSTNFSQEQLETLADYCIDEDVVTVAVRKSGKKHPYADDENEEDVVPQRPKKHGFLKGLFVVGAILDAFSSPAKSHHCDGDCDNCPAHYGYRYGRWYYGHGHQHGCERGGNGGASGKCYRD